MKSLTHYLNAAENRILNYIYKQRGWTTDRKIVVIESDDWGSIRMPSVDILNELIKKGIELHPELGYDKYDTLESNDDLLLLMEVLYSVKDRNNNPPKITLNYLMTNPDFRKIKESNFRTYHYELFTETLKKYPNHDNVFALVKEGIENNIFMPQFHGREHLNVQMWLDALRKNYPGVRESFDVEVFCNYIDKKIDSRHRFLDAYNVINREEYAFVLESIREGLDLFDKVFGFKSLSMIAPNYTWDPEIEKTISDNGVKVFQGGGFQKFSEYKKRDISKSGVFHFIGETNIYKQVYLSRNCLFEPSQNSSYGYKRCLEDINLAFRLNKPAIITAHRLNFIGGLHSANRDNNLIQLKQLLNKIIKMWPNIEFMSSDELGSLIMGQTIDS